MNSPFVLVIFGATGDLSHNKLIPALFSLFKSKQLPEQFFIVGFARRNLTDADFAASFDSLSQDSQWQEFAKHLTYQSGSFDSESGYTQLVTKLSAFDEFMGACITRIFYLATPPEHYEVILQFLATTKLSEGCGQGSNKWTRIAIEKPFGKDLETARLLDKKLGEIFDENQIFRVDHYLGKETVQNMLVFRFANGIFEPIWNTQYLDHVQITLAEEKGIGSRGRFFDGVGELRDMGQTHLLQLLATVAMEMPKSFSKEGVRDARAKAMASLECIEPSQVDAFVVRGQYASYLQEVDVDQNSQTETFVAAKLFINSPRFSGVPFYVRAGKKMPKNSVTISLVFRQTCHILFKEIGCPEEGNVLTFSIQPNEGVTLKVITKTPGSSVALGSVDMKFKYEEAFGHKGKDAYEKVLVDILAGDQMLFNRSDELESSWEFITNILRGWSESSKSVLTYQQGEWGPKAAQELIEQDGRKWIE